MASVVAARRKEYEIAVGNLVGSNISNVLVVLTGTQLASWWKGTTVGRPGVLLASDYILVDYIMVCTVSVVFLLLARVASRVGASSGVALLVFYFGYMTYRVIGELTFG